MYIVEIKNGQHSTKIHGHGRAKLKSGSVVKGINAIDTFSFSILPSNSGFSQINDFTTLVSVFNTNKNRYEFFGRALYSDTTMSDSGLITKDVTCESYMGFLCDSQQTYVEERNWTVSELLNHIIDTHNTQVEDYKRFTIGTLSVTAPNNNVYCGIQRENTWDTIKKKLIDTLGGEIQYRVSDGTIYIDYMEKIGSVRATKISVSHNMKSITEERDPSAYVTRLIPLGSKLKKEVTSTDNDGNETTQTKDSEERTDITSVNDGRNYIDDVTAIEKYGIHVGYQYWDDVSVPANLKRKAEEWLAQNNKVQIKYSITALDLSLLGLDVDDFEVHDYYPIVNPLIGIDDTARIVKKTIDICLEVSSSIEIGENLKALSDIQNEKFAAVSDVVEAVKKIESDYLTNEAVQSETLALTSLIQQNAESIILSVQEAFETKTASEEFKNEVVAKLSILADEISMKFTSTSQSINSIEEDLQTQLEDIHKFIRFSDNGISIGSSDSSISLEIDNDMIVFKKNGAKFGWWDGNDFHTGNIFVDVNEQARFGNFAFLPRSDGSLMFLKVGG